MKKYDEIVALVHPLFDAIYTNNSPKFFNNNYKNPNIENIKKKNTKGQILIKNIKKTLGIYGDFLNSYASKKNTCVVVFIPRSHFLRDSPEIQNIIEKENIFYNKILEKFLTNYKKIFKERIYITNYDKQLTNTKPCFSKHIIHNLKKEVSLTVIGEYYNQWMADTSYSCVTGWKDYMVLELKKKKILPKKINIITEKTLLFKGFGLTGFRKAVLPANVRRKFQNKEKKRKLLNNKKRRKLRLNKKPR